MNNISFDNPWLLFIALPMFLAFIIPFCITVRRENANFHNVTALCLNLLICVCVALAFAGLTFERVITETNVYVLADVSYSSERKLDEVQENIEKISKKLPKNSKMGVICFARDYKLVSSLGAGVPDIAAAAASLDQSATDIGAALRYAGNIFDTDVIKRIIVITDGVETVTTNNIVRVVNNLQDNGVYVDAVYIDDNLPADVNEIQIDDVEFNASTYIGKTEEANVLVHANFATDAGGSERKVQCFVNVYRNGEFADRHSEVLYAGFNSVTVPLPTEEAGPAEYRITIEPDNKNDDTSPENNVCFFSQNVSDEKMVLFLGGSSADVAAGKQIYGEKDVDYFSSKSGIPTTVESLCKYDEIVLFNFKVTEDDRGMHWGQGLNFINSLSVLVRDFGKTVITYGDTYIEEYKNGEENIQNEALKALQGLLPVNIGNKDQDTRLVALVLDVSLSMNTASKLESAKNIAKEIVNNALKPTDTVMVMGYSYGQNILLYPTKLTSPTAVTKAIENIKPENHTYLGTALESTYSYMAPLRYYDKQVIIISDAVKDPASDKNGDWGNAITQADKLTAANITISAIGIIPDDAGKTFLKTELVDNHNINGKGFYIGIENENQIKDKIGNLTSDMSEVKIEDSCDIILKRLEEDVLDGVVSLGNVNNVWYSWAKPSAYTVVTAHTKKNTIEDVEVPLYAYWNGGGGNGKVISFLADPKDGWTDNAGWKQFFENLPNATLPSVRITQPFAVKAERDGNNTVISVKTSGNVNSGATFTAVMTAPDNSVSSRTLIYNSGTYYANFQTDAPGTYQIEVQYTYEENEPVKAYASFSVNYYAEYDSFTSFNKSALYRLLSEGGSILELDETDRLENTDSEYTTYIFDFTMTLMIISAVLFVASIAIRQLKWADIVSFFSGSKGGK